MGKIYNIKLEKRKLFNWKIVSLWSIVLVILIFCMKTVLNSNSIYISINYAPYGTSQNNAKLEYGKGIFKRTIQERIEDFNVTFKVNVNHIDDAVIRIGDQSGTVQIKSIEIQSNGQYMMLLNEEILDYFVFDQVDHCEAKDEWVEIFTYNIEQSKLTLSADLVSRLTGDKEKHSWFVFLFGLILSVILFFVIYNRKKSKYFYGIYEKLIIYVRTEEREKFVKVGILAVLGCIIFSEQVSDFVFDNMIKYHNVIISNSYLREGGEQSLKIFDNKYEDESNILTPNIIDEKKYGYYDFTKLKNAIIGSRDILIKEPEESEYKCGYFEFLEDDSYIVLSLPVYPNTCLTLSTENNQFATSITDMINGYSRIVAYENVTGANSIKIYPYKISDYMYVLFDYLCVYIILFLALSLIILVGGRCLCYLLYQNNFALSYNPIKIFIFMTIGYVVFTSITYYLDPQRYGVGPGADAYYYMNPQMLDENGQFSLSVVSEYLYSFRGYFSVIIAIGAKGLTLLTGIDIIYFYIVYYGIVVAFTIGIAMPQLYEYFTDKQANNAMSLSMFVVFSIVWYPFFYYALVDIPAAMCAISGVAYILSALKRTDAKKMVFGGILFGISLSYRMAYKYIFVVVAFWVLVELGVKVYNKKINWCKVGLIIAGLVGGFVLIALPQFVLNYERGHIGLFPYSGGWKYDVNTNTNASFVWTGFTTGFHTYGLGGKPNSDTQFAYIDQFFYMGKIYSFGDLLYIILSNPVEFCVGYFKHLFWAMSAEIEDAYGKITPPMYLQIVTVLFNYFMIGEYLLIFFNAGKTKLIKIKDIFLVFLLTVSSICIQNLSHIERRYYLFYYLFIYFVFSFIFQNYCKQEKEHGKKIDLKHFVVMSFVILGCYIFRRTIECNFL